MPHVNMNVHIRVRYTGWARFVLRVASALHRIPVAGYPLCRLVYCACWMQIRCDGKVVATPWRWMRVPFPKVSK